MDVLNIPTEDSWSIDQTSSEHTINNSNDGSLINQIEKKPSDKRRRELKHNQVDSQGPPKDTNNSMSKKESL